MSIEKKISESLANQIEGVTVPAEVDERVRQSFRQFHTKTKKEHKTMKKRLLALGLTAAILIPTGVFALNSSYFAGPDVNLNGLVDDGVKRAVSEGLSVTIDQKITDQGITVHFDEMYVEETKILVHYKIEREDGSLVPYEFDTTGLQVISDGKKDNKQVENPTYQQSGLEGFSVLNFIGTERKDNLPFTLTDASGKEIDTGIAEKDKPEGMLAFVTSGKKLPSTIVLHVDIDRIGKTKGSWKGQIPIDQSKAQKATEAAK
ncbi:DUF4179 domain-containing protein [Brevibacillus fluminis]|uniref:DUF4179 domain-containing protein n=1 Tax=Brevibacillus fluminis TaxID=511487 RepID=A0A3M8DIE8_9BACL|nr:DUF4179 domain-containing protein [Brevibacillus fluminis]RNB87882.1 DUF4179 domain-containing protein [Brevibacillus fluminis]